ncbi:MAG: PDZ domain-containing protein [Planctomycetota bacterium]|nr:PDZ domain-containing protein [Planctomycetota bacterium]
MLRSVFVLSLIGLVGAAPEKVIFGIVPVKDGDFVRVSYVLPQSSAAAAGLRKGDILHALGEKKIREVGDVKEALARKAPGDPLEVFYIRKKKNKKKKVRLLGRNEYRGESLRSRTRGSKGFPAPEWHAYAWGNLKEGQEPPTRNNTRGKVVVIHCFQSW